MSPTSYRTAPPRGKELRYYSAPAMPVNLRGDTLARMNDLERVADALGNAARVTILTGAGVSAASGIPTFRGADGLWNKVRAETLATPEAFEHDPNLAW